MPLGVVKLTRPRRRYILSNKWSCSRANRKPIVPCTTPSRIVERPFSTPKIPKIYSKEAGGCPTFRTFLPTYWQTLKIHHRIDLRRPAIILNTHLLPRFGDRPLDSLTAEDGLSYIAARLDAGAAPGTVRKEWGVLMRILNLAVDFEKIERNRLTRVHLPEANKRTRVATAKELVAIQAVADREIWRIVEVALHTGLREARILEIERSWMHLRDDGWWLILPPPRSALKGTPRELPLNRIALAALKSEIAPSDGLIFPRRTSDALNKAWSRMCKRGRVCDLHFHDLRHTFTTLLQNLGVPLEVRSALLGHRLRSDALGSEAMTTRYSHGGQGWNQQLRHAVTHLEAAILSYGLSYEPFSDESALVVKTETSLKDQARGWWSQRDLNPCLNHGYGFAIFSHGLNDVVL